MADTDVNLDTEEKAKKKRQRSPSYPALNLEECLNRAKVVWAEERKNTAPLAAIVSHWGYGPKSSSGLLAIAALKKFGLLVEVDGTPDRQFRLSDSALDILLEENERSPQRNALLREAALKPEMHKEMWDKYGAELPSEATIRNFLLREKDFTDTAADQFIQEYKETISFANVAQRDIIPKKDAKPEAGLLVGDMVQWESQGMLQFPEPRRVTGIDGDYAFVDGQPTGLPVEQLKKVDAPMVAQNTPATQPQAPPANPQYRPSGPSLGMDIFGDNRIEIRLSRKVTRAEWQKLKQLFEFAENSFVSAE